MQADDADGVPVPTATPEQVERLDLPQRADAYLAAHRLLQERLGLGAP